MYLARATLLTPLARDYAMAGRSYLLRACYCPECGKHYEGAPNARSPSVQHIACTDCKKARNDGH
jgi:hypothetical protein